MADFIYFSLEQFELQKRGFINGVLIIGLSRASEPARRLARSQS